MTRNKRKQKSRQAHPPTTPKGEQTKKRERARSVCENLGTGESIQLVARNLGSIYGCTIDWRLPCVPSFVFFFFFFFVLD